MDGRTDGRTDGRREGGREGGRDGWMDVGMYVRTYVRMCARMQPCFLAFLIKALLRFSSVARTSVWEQMISPARGPLTSRD